MTKQILVVEDDRSLSEILKYNLELSGYKVFVAFDGKQGLEMALTKRPDIVILDVMLPILSGLEVCNRIRNDAEIKDVAIIMLSAKTQEVDQVVGFTMGADDYVAKPFSVNVLLERIKAVRRRANPAVPVHIVERNGIRIDRLKHQASIADKMIDLTPSEFRLLDTLIRQPGRAFDRNELIDSALGEDAVVTERTIDVHIRSLRKKMGDHCKFVQTVRGIGYRFSEGSDQ